MLNYILKFPLVGVGGDGKPRKLIYFHFYHSPSPATSFSRIFYIFNTSVFCNECVKNLSFFTFNWVQVQQSTDQIDNLKI